jgi:hypothetical protein
MSQKEIKTSSINIDKTERENASLNTNPKTNLEINMGASQVIINRYKNVSLLDFKKILDEIDTNLYDKDLDFILDLVIALRESRTICKQLQSGFNSSLHQFHHSRAEYMVGVLEQFTWFNELKEQGNTLTS